MSNTNEICKRTIAKIKLDIIAMEAEYKRLLPHEHDKRVQKIISIENAKEIIKDLEQTIKTGE